MDDQPEVSPAGDHGSSDEETVKGDREEEHIADILEEERQLAYRPVTPIGNGSIARRYHDIIEAVAGAEEASENGSTDAIPRRVGSPIDSLLSAPDDSPSVQVGTYDLWKLGDPV
jgi:hypothetical protein